MVDPTSALAHRLAGEQQTFARALRSLVPRDPVTCDTGATLTQVAQLMRVEGVGSVVVTDAHARAIGIVTSHDMTRVVAEAAGALRVAEIMSTDPVALPAHALAYEAAVVMLARRIRHVLVIEGERLIGVVSERNLFSLQRLGLGELSMELRLAGDLGTLRGLAADIRGLTARLVEQGVAPEQLTLFISVLNDRLSQRVIELVRKRHDLERISWCWLAFGSEGRFEQTLATDQDNGLIFVAHDGASPGEVRARVLPFAREVNEGLDACGFPLCRGNVMASNAELCLSVEEWQAKMTRWIEASLPKALLDAAICFDFRPLYGDASLAAALRDWVAAHIRRHATFLRHMAEAALQAGPGLTRFGGFATEDVPEGRGTINLKSQGVRIFVDVARIYALARGVAQTNTADRLRALPAVAGLSETEAEAASEAFYLIQRLRLQQQVARPQGERELGNRVVPDRLSRLDQAGLKEALRIARELQTRLAMDYQL